MSKNEEISSTLIDILEVLAITPEDLAAVSNVSLKDVREILAGEKVPTTEMIDKFHEKTALKRDFWENLLIDCGGGE